MAPFSTQHETDKRAVMEFMKAIMTSQAFLAPIRARSATRGAGLGSPTRASRSFRSPGAPAAAVVRGVPRFKRSRFSTDGHLCALVRLRSYSSDPDSPEALRRVGRRLRAGSRNVQTSDGSGYLVCGAARRRRGARAVPDRASKHDLLVNSYAVAAGGRGRDRGDGRGGDHPLDLGKHRCGAAGHVLPFVQSARDSFR